MDPMGKVLFEDGMFSPKLQGFVEGGGLDILDIW